MTFTNKVFIIRNMAKKKLGRPPKKFTAAQKKKIEELAFRGLKSNAIATYMAIDENTLERHFGELCRKKRIDRKLWLLDLQNNKANDSDTTMLIWLGKNVLEQTDKQETTHDIKNNLADFLMGFKGE